MRPAPACSTIKRIQSADPHTANVMLCHEGKGSTYRESDDALDLCQDYPVNYPAIS